MEDLHIDQDFASGQVTLVVFTPDAIMSRLVGAIERWLREQTHCVPIARRWFAHTRGTLDRFYPKVAACGPAASELVARAFTAGPCLATLWFGEAASQVIPRAKGATEPALCAASTLRGRFWCENGVTNLVHVSDDGVDVAHEIGVLRSVEPGLFRERFSTQGLTPFLDAGSPTPRHSGILTLCSLVTTLLSTTDHEPLRLDLSDDESARETMLRAEAWLTQARACTSLEVARAIDAFLDGAADPARLVSDLTNAVPVGPWEAFTLRCGLLSRPRWLERRA